MKTHRLARVAEVVREVASETILFELQDPRVKGVTVTRADKNIVFELAGRPPMKVLQEMLPRLPARDQQLVRSALLLGRVVNEYKEEFTRGDFLVRNLIGSDPQSGALKLIGKYPTGKGANWVEIVAFD